LGVVTNLSPIGAVLLIASGVLVAFGAGLLVLRLRLEQRTRFTKSVLQPLAIVAAVGLAAAAAYRRQWSLVGMIAFFLFIRGFVALLASLTRSGRMTSQQAKLADEFGGYGLGAIMLVSVGLSTDLSLRDWLMFGGAFNVLIAAIAVIRRRRVGVKTEA